GLADITAEQLAQLVFRASAKFKLREHQAQALTVSLARDGSPERNVVVTSGTGSGKTECFLLPIFARLLAESPEWGDAQSLHPWWRMEDESLAWKHLRSRGRQGRSAAVRAIVLYPTNALVEDQVSRIRRAVARIALNGKAPSFFFGRYTGATIGN